MSSLSKNDWVTEALGAFFFVSLGILLALLFIGSGAKAGTVKVDAVIHDPLKGTVHYDQNVQSIQYAGAFPYVLTLRESLTKSTQGFLKAQPENLHYYCISKDYCKLEGIFTAYAPSRVFAAGFEK